MWRQISKSNPDWELDIIGPGSELAINFLQNHINEYGISDSAHLIGLSKDIKSLMKEASIFALPSREEGFPCVLLEAMSQGCTPISFSIRGNISEIITDNKDGYIIPDNNLTLFSVKLSHLMKNQELREQMSKEAIKSMERFEVDKIVDQWEALITDVVNKKK